MSELTVRLNDLLQKWTKECKTVQDIRDMMVQEQLLDALPRELKIWVAERKPKRSKETAELADNYLRARKHEHRTEPSGSRQDKGSSWNKGARDARDAPKVPSGRETLGGQAPRRIENREAIHALFHLWQKGPYCKALSYTNALVCIGLPSDMRREGTVNGRSARNIILTPVVQGRWSTATWCQKHRPWMGNLQLFDVPMGTVFYIPWLKSTSRLMGAQLVL